MNISITGECLTKLAREIAFLHKNPHDAMMVLNAFLSSDMTETQSYRTKEDILLGRAEFKGTSGKDLHLVASEGIPNRQLSVWDTITNVRKAFDKQGVLLQIVAILLREMKNHLPVRVLQEIAKDMKNSLSEEEYIALQRFLLNSDINFFPLDEVIAEQPEEEATDTQRYSTDDYGWLEPNGKFHAVEYGGHEVWAERHLREEDPDYDEFEDSGHVLLTRGWVLLHNPCLGLAHVTRNGAHRLTKGQREFLYEYFIERNCRKEAEECFHDY